MTMPNKYDHDDRPQRQDVPVEVTESTDQNRSYWTSRPYLANDVRVSLENASVVIIPREGFRDYTGPVFPVGTEEIFRLLKDGLPASVPVEIAANDDNYHELALHSATLIIGAFIVTSLAAPLVVNLLSDYVSRRCSRKDNSSVRFEMKMEDDAGRTMSISYDGPAEQFSQTVGSAVKGLLSRSQPTTALPSAEAGDDNKQA